MGSSEEDRACDAVEFSPCCAFVALHLLSRSAVVPGSDGGGTVLLGSAQLLGLIIERAQRRRDGLEERLRMAESEAREMKRQRTEDAKANDKVVGIFASHEQSWIADRKRLRYQIRVLVDELQCLKASNEEAVTRLNKRAMEAECAVRLKEEAFAEEERKREELEEKLRLAKEEASSALADLQAEIGCALRQAEEAKQELAGAFAEKEEAVSMAEKLSGEIAKLSKDMEQKDRILSAMLRKSKLDSADREVLQKEVRIAKAKKKQAELETDRWRNKWESRHHKGPKSPLLSDAGSSEQSSSNGYGYGYGYSTRTLLLEYLGQEWQKEHNPPESKEENVVAAVKCLDHYLSSNSRQDLVTADIEHLQNWVQLEVEKRASILGQRQYEEVEAFIEQMRVKDEKLAAIRWRIVSMEVESKRLHSCIEALDGSLSRTRADNLKLEALLLDREEEIRSLKERFGVSLRQKKAMEKDRDRKSYKDRTIHDIVTISSVDSAAASHRLRINEISSEEAESLESSSGEQEKSITLVALYPSEIVGEDKEVNVDPGHSLMQKSPLKEAFSPNPLMKKDTFGKMDIQALGVAYKIKRLKQQLVVLEKLAGMNRDVANGVLFDDSDGSDDNKRQQQPPPKGFVLVLSLLNKQVKRFQSLEDRTDDLCRRMSVNYGSNSHRDSPNGKTKEQRKILHGFLEETFQLQRYMVATGQKLMDIQSKISGSFGGMDGLEAEESAGGFNIKQFAEVIRSLFREIQRGLELRIARIIGDIEGTLACNGILHM